MPDTPYVLALILARAGSKGVPGKNIMPIAGRPLITYTIDQAKHSQRITRVIVSTDGPDIAEIARASGAEVPFMRPDEMAQDFSPDIDAFRHCLNWLRDVEGRLPDLIVHLRPTGPIRRVALIDDAIERMLNTPSATALRSVTLAKQTPFKMWFVDDDAHLKPVVTLPDVREAHSLARQSLPKAYWQNGYVDIVRPDTVLKMGSMVGPRPLAFVVNEPKYEIDYPEDVPAVEEAIVELRAKGALLTGNTVDEDDDRHPV